MRAEEVSDGSPTVIGRASNCTITLHEETVSRRHVRLKPEEGTFFAENLSRTNPTKVNDVAIDRPVLLSDRDTVELGMVRMVFHDLSTATGASKPVCSHCSHENTHNDKDCWYCGTSLVNAPSLIRERLAATCRIVSAGGQAYDLYPSEGFAIGANGAGMVIQSQTLARDAVATVEVISDGPVLVLRSLDGGLTVNGEAASDQEFLKTGDEVRVGDGQFMMLVR